ncbi:hypothetical protein I8752_25715 [Nostocaceae cyanobacterium CENA369]|uniref:Uncharacterized protein n=1 Tax=Dendronalium phyllosphericum CENA369 TaxID=1725256 RepID=A0A8J7IE27_9NOST|nr:hypothetical protein [Dendronalium phyllosphericum]MBH8576327.1 hypothetical protein [Dendronalium phyllosphericum CENA369]
MYDSRPGLNSHRLVRLIQQAIGRCELQLDNLTVFTEAATGAYAVTPVVAAIAGAKKVFAIARSSRYGTLEQIKAQTLELAELAGVGDRIQFLAEKTEDIVAQADIITNSGHVRPINAEMIAWMKPTAVIGLMYEAWEFRSEDVDLIACRQRGIKVAGVNERHPGVDVFSFLGIMAAKLLLDAGVSVYTSDILLLCDNPFSSFIERGLVNAGASVDTVDSISAAPTDRTYDAILVALQPCPEPVLTATNAALIAKYWPGALVAQYWGDIERSALVSHHIPVCPEIEPKPGHMGILPSAVGPEPIIRLQTGGLKAAEAIWRESSQSSKSAMEFVQLL